MENIVIIPTYNERENISNILHAIFNLNEGFHVLVIDDGSPDGTAAIVKELQQKLHTKEFRKRLFVKHGQKLVSVDVDEIAYFFSDGRLNFFKTNDNRKFVVDYTMDELNEMLDPDKYFRISRSFFISVNSVSQIHDYFGNRLILQLKPETDKEAIVSREKVTDFKNWLGK